MKKMLVLGAGRVARPCVNFLADQGYEVFLSDISEENIERCIEEKKGVHKIVGDVMEGLPKILEEVKPDVLISLLPPSFMVAAAEACIDAGVHYVNPSYIKADMRALNEAAESKGITLLCELGLDPGIDHMSACKAIHEIHDEGGELISFKSWCGALPAPKYNNNPLGYKLSWAPASLISASRREAKTVRDGKVIVWPNGETYAHAGLVDIQGMGWFEEYANADSTPYIETYNMPEVQEVYRGTLRYPGWCEMICKMQDLGLYDDAVWDFSGMTCADVTRKLIGAERGINLREALSTYLDLERCSSVIMKLEWLGLLEEKAVQIAKGTMYQFVECLYNDKLNFGSKEEDVSIMEHRYLIRYPNRKVLRRSTLVDYGSADGDFSVARLTGLPPAIGAKLIAEGKIKKKGVISPTMPEVYLPALRVLEELGIVFKEEETILN